MKRELRNHILFGFCLLLGYTQISYSWHFSFASLRLVNTKDIEKIQSLIRSGEEKLSNAHLAYTLAKVSIGIILLQNSYLQRKNIKSAYRSLKRVFKHKVVKQKTEQEKVKKEAAQNGN